MAANGVPDPALEAVIQRTYQAFNRRDVDAVLAVMRPDVDWPDVAGGTRVVGHEAVRAYWARQFEVIDPRVEPTALVARADGEVVVTVHQVVRDRASGQVLHDGTVLHVYRFDADGLVASMTVHPGPSTGTA